MSLINSFFKSYSSKSHLTYKSLTYAAGSVVYNESSLLCSTSIISIQTRGLKTIKRRKTHPFKWWVKKDGARHDGYIDKTNQQFVQEVIKREKELSPLKYQEDSSQRNREWTPESRRVGLIAMKIGILPYWTKEGKRGLTTVLQVKDNHVIKSYTTEQYKDMVIHQNRWRWDGSACLIVGSDSGDPQNFSAAYAGLFTEAGVLPKKKITNMMVTDDALLTPGTPLSVKHFVVGQYVNCYGKTIDHGFQGVMRRWFFRGLPDANGVTKAHRRPGSISRGRKASGPWKGKKMPGHMGSERRPLFNAKIIRIDYENQLLFLKGPAVPGSNGAWVYVYDSTHFEKRHTMENPPPFPTFFEEENQGNFLSESSAPTEDQEEGESTGSADHHQQEDSSSSGRRIAGAGVTDEKDEKKPLVVYSGEIHQFDAPTIVFKEDESEKKVIRTGAKLAKVRTKN